MRTTLAVHVTLAGFLTVHALSCVDEAEQLCTLDGACAAFGIYGTQIQLHGCVALVANTDWTIYTRNGTSYTQLPGKVNINENACTTHPNTGMTHECSSPQPPQLYSKQGSIDVGTFENTIFYWGGVLYNLGQSKTSVARTF